MKKMKVILALLLVVGIALARCSVAQAAEDEMVVVHAGRTVDVLGDDELIDISTEMIGGVNGMMTSNTSYTAYRYTDVFEYFFNGEMVARANAECVVWHYTDGKVHLYQRSIQLIKSPTIGAARIYGSIVNTDGSYSYTTGDRIHLYLDEGTWSYAIDFYVSGETGYFTCYEV